MTANNTNAQKNKNRIDEIESRLAIEKELNVLTSTASRVLKRDWNIVCSKMYVFSLDRRLGKKIRQALDDLHWAVRDLQESAPIGMFRYQSTEWLQPRPFTLRIVSAEAASWLRAIVAIDGCVAKMLSAEKDGYLTKEQRIRLLRPTNIAYVNFKFSAMNKPLVQDDEASESSIFQEHGLRVVDSQGFSSD